MDVAGMLVLVLVLPVLVLLMAVDGDDSG